MLQVADSGQYAGAGESGKLGAVGSQSRTAGATTLHLTSPAGLSGVACLGEPGTNQNPGGYCARAMFYAGVLAFIPVVPDNSGCEKHRI